MAPVRRAVESDAAAVRALLEAEPFWKADFRDCLHAGVVALVHLDAVGAVNGFLALSDAPPDRLRNDDPKLESRVWTEWFYGDYDRVGLTSMNTLWVTTLAGQLRTSDEALKQALAAAFAAQPHLTALLCLLPAEAPPEKKDPDNPNPKHKECPARELEVFERLDTSPHVVDAPWDVYCCRHEFVVPPIRVREAEVEDYDDLAPVFEEQSELVQAVYGEFFLAELIEGQDEHHKCYTAEGPGGRAVGLISLTKEVDLGRLQMEFDLSPYNQLLAIAEEEEEKEVAVRMVDHHVSYLSEMMRRFAEGRNAKAPPPPPPPELTEEDEKGEPPAAQEDPAREYKKVDLVEILDDYFEPGEDVDTEAEDYKPTAWEAELRSEHKSALRDKETSARRLAEILQAVAGPDLLVIMLRVLSEMPAAVGEHKEESLDFAQVEKWVHRPAVAEFAGEWLPCYVVAVNGDGSFSVRWEADGLYGRVPAVRTEPPVPILDTEISMDIDNEACVAVSLFGLDQAHQSHMDAVLRAAFSALPDVDYMILTVPSTAEVTPLMRRFTRLEPRPDSSFDHLLYVLSRNGVTPEVSVRFAQERDRLSIEEAFEDSEVDYDAALTACLQQKAGEAFVALADDQVVCMAVVRDCADAASLRRHYDLDLHAAYAGQGPNETREMTCFLMNPAFRVCGRNILREVMRLSGHTTLVHRVTGEDRPHDPVLEQLRLVRPRRNVNAVEPLQGGPFGLYAISRRGLSERVVVRNNRIVVVGASETGLAAIETLLGQPDVECTSITLVDRGGLDAADVRCGGARRRLLLQNHVRVIKADMTGLRHEEKVVTLQMVDDRHTMNLAYDVLLMASGLRTAVPPVQRGDGQGVAENGISGLVALHANVQDQSALAEPSGKVSEVVIVVDDCMTGALASLPAGVNEANVTILCSGNPDARTVGYLAILGGAGCRVLAECDVRRVVVRPNGTVASLQLQFPAAPDANIVPFAAPSTDDPGDAEEKQPPAPAAHRPDLPTLTATAEDGVYEMACDYAVLATRPSRMDPRIFQCVDQNPYVIDGRLIVDSNMLTKATGVYCAGPMAMFSRQLGAACPMEDNDSGEVGREAALSILRGMAGGAAEALPPFSLPKVRRARLTADATVFSAERHAKAAGQCTIVDWDDAKTKGRCEVVVDGHGYLQRITLVTADGSLDFGKLAALVGLHTDYLHSSGGFDIDKAAPKTIICELMGPKYDILRHDRFRALQATLAEQSVALAAREGLHEKLQAEYASSRRVSRESIAKHTDGLVIAEEVDLKRIYLDWVLANDDQLSYDEAKGVSCK